MPKIETTVTLTRKEIDDAVIDAAKKSLGGKAIGGCRVNYTPDEGETTQAVVTFAANTH